MFWVSEYVGILRYFTGLETKEQEMVSKERQMEKMKQEAQQALATKDRQIGKLREDAAQLQRQLQELRLTPDGAGDSIDTRSQVQVGKYGQTSKVYNVW